MGRYASGRNAYGISDRSGFRYRLSEMRTEWNGSKVGPDEYEAKHPQLEPLNAGPDPQALRNPRPDQYVDLITRVIVRTNVGGGFIGGALSKLNGLTSSVGTVTITSDASSTTSVTASVTAVTGTGSIGTSAYTGQIFAVTVAEYSGANKYFIDGTRQATVNLTEGQTYRFDQSDSTNNGHPLRFSLTSDGTHGGGSEYTTGVTTSGTPGYSGAYTEITVAASVATLYYYCTNHSGMGGQANTP